MTAQIRLALYRGMIGDTEGGLALASSALEGGDSRQFALAAKAQAYLSAGEYFQAQESMTEASKGFENGVSDPPAGYSVFQIIEGHVALANGRYDHAPALADRALGVGVDQENHPPEARPVRVTNHGKPVLEAFG